jgi:hypothetical protein
MKQIRLRVKTISRLVFITLIVSSFCSVLSAQSFKKTFKFLVNEDIEKAQIELSQFTEEAKSSGEDFLLYGLARCLVVCSEEYQAYDPYKSLKMYDITTGIEADRYEVDIFLKKYKLSISIIRNRIYQSIFNDAKSLNTEQSYQRALDVCQGCFYEDEVTELKNTVAYIECKNSKSIKGYIHFLSAYPNSEHVDEIRKLLEEAEFAYAKSRMTLYFMENYINRYSNNSNKFIPIAVHLRDSIAFSAVIKTYSEYVEFSKKYPNSEYNKSIIQVLPDLLFNEAIYNKDVELMDFFLSEYPKDIRVEILKLEIEKLYYVTLLKSRSTEQFKSFKRRFPESKYILELDKYIEGDYEYFTDIRDGKTYKTIKIGNQVWMAENIRYEGVRHAPLPKEMYDDQTGIRGPYNDYYNIYGNA